MTVTLTLTADVARLLEEKARSSGRSLEDYLAQLAENDAQLGWGTAPHLQPSFQEYDNLLDELATGPPLPRLPLDFSRADIYADHD
jgi:hypothetical protein